MITAAVVVALGIAAFAGSLALGVPGPGLWPMLVSGVLTVLGAALFVLRPGDAEPFTRAEVKVVAAVGAMAGFVALLPVIGFEIPSAVLAFGWMRFLGRESWRTSGITSVVTVAAFYALFVGLLNVPIPHLF